MSFLFDRRPFEQEPLVGNVAETPLNSTHQRSPTHVPAMFISWHDLNAYVNTEKKRSSKDVERKEGGGSRQVLNNVFGCANPGEVLAIMGSSGSGKTTILNILTQRNLAGLHVNGNIKVNGEVATKQTMKKLASYCEQDDCFIGSLTVKEHLIFNARLKMGLTHSKSEQNRRVHAVLADLGLKDISDNVIGTRTRKGISGGEKKRLAFASEILTSPPILLCDEPTSGLDAFLAYQVVLVLKKLAEAKGMTIVLTIHQPSSQVFQLFDRIYLLAEGRVAFCGSPAAAEGLWDSVGRPLPQNFNPADHYIATLSATKASERSKVVKICDEFLKSRYGKDLLQEIKNDEETSGHNGGISRDRANTLNVKYKAGWWQQLSMLTWRNSKTTLREPTLVRVQVMQAIIISLITGFVYLNNSINQAQVMNINGAMFQMITNMAFMFQYSSVYNFCLEFPTFHREHGSNLYRVSSYFLAKNLAELPAYTLCAVIFSSIFYWMSGMVPTIDAFAIYLLAAVLVMNVAISVGYCFACIFGTVTIAHTFLPIYVTPMFAFGGFFINQDSLPIFFYPFKYLSHLRYGFEIVATNEWTRIDEIPGCPPGSSRCSRDGQDVLVTLGFGRNPLWVDVLSLLGLFLVIRCIAFLALFIRSKVKK